MGAEISLSPTHEPFNRNRAAPSALETRGWEIQLPTGFPLAGLPRGQDTAPCFLLGAAGTGGSEPFPPRATSVASAAGGAPQAGALRVPQTGTLRGCRLGKPLCRASQAVPLRSVPARAAFPTLAALHLLTRKCLSFTES